MTQDTSPRGGNRVLGLLVVAVATSGIAVTLLLLDGVARAALALLLSAVAVAGATYVVTRATANGDNRS